MSYSNQNEFIPPPPYSSKNEDIIYQDNNHNRAYNNSTSNMTPPMTNTNVNDNTYNRHCRRDVRREARRQRKHDRNHCSVPMCTDNNHIYRTRFSFFGVLMAILFFPFGLVFLFCCTHTACVKCGHRGY